MNTGGHEMEIEWTRQDLLQGAVMLTREVQPRKDTTIHMETARVLMDLAVSIFFSRASGRVKDLLGYATRVLTDGSMDGTPEERTEAVEAATALAALAQEAEALRAKVAELEEQRDYARDMSGSLKTALDAARADVERLKAEMEAKESANGDTERQPTIAELEEILSAPENTYSVEVRPDGQVRAVKRYPCSPTCTHDDARTPGHPERVRERSEAVLQVVQSGEEQESDGYADGVHDTRAAVEKWARESFGEVPPTLKAVLDGVAP